MLIRNFLREIISTLPRLLAVIVVTALGAIIYVGMSGYAFNLAQVADSYYPAQNTADYWIYGAGMTKSDGRQIERFDSVKSVQPRISIQAEYFRDKSITLSLHGISGDFTINKPYVVSGKLFESNRECMLDVSHAEAHGIQVGDKIELRVKESGQKLVFTVSALVKSPEYLYNVSGTELVPDSYKNGFAYVKEDALGSIKELIGYNEMCVVLQENADGQLFKEDLERLLGTKLLKLLSFDDNQRASILVSSIEETTALTTSLPMLFFFIAAFIMFSTMTTVVENSRMMIGTLKALGYGQLSIVSYFLSYAFTVVLFGTALGVLPARLMTSALMNLLNASISLPEYAVTVDFTSILKVTLLTTAICAGTAALVCIRELKVVPAECMRPKAPRVGKMNLIERIRPLWSRMSFVQKTITRNIVRNKARLIMCVLGVSGCMAIIITAFGFIDSTANFMTIVYSNLHRYDLQVKLKSNTSQTEVGRILRLVGVDKAERVMELPIKASKAGRSSDTTISVMEDTISLMVLAEDAPDMMTMPDDGAILSSYVAKKLDVEKGDTVGVILAGQRNGLELRVSDIRDNISGFYVGQTFWRKLGEGYSPSTVYLSADQATITMEEARRYDFVSSVKSKADIVESINSQMSTMNTMAFLLIVFGAVLDLVVLYNLGIMNYYERMRELATLKVLGFFDHEITVLVLRENTIFTCIGILFGIPLGIGLHSSMLSKSSTQDMTFMPFISSLTFVYAAGLTFAFSLFVNFLLSRKMRQIDMLGALKSVE